MTSKKKKIMATFGYISTYEKVMEVLLNYVMAFRPKNLNRLMPSILMEN